MKSVCIIGSSYKEEELIKLTAKLKESNIPIIIISRDQEFDYKYMYKDIILDNTEVFDSPAIFKKLAELKYFNDKELEGKDFKEYPSKQDMLYQKEQFRLRSTLHSRINYKRK